MANNFASQIDNFSRLFRQFSALMKTDSSAGARCSAIGRTKLRIRTQREIFQMQIIAHLLAHRRLWKWKVALFVPMICLRFFNTFHWFESRSLEPLYEASPWSISLKHLFGTFFAVPPELRHSIAFLWECFPFPRKPECVVFGRRNSFTWLWSGSLDGTYHREVTRRILSGAYRELLREVSRRVTPLFPTWTN